VASQELTSCLIAYGDEAADARSRLPNEPEAPQCIRIPRPASLPADSQLLQALGSLAFTLPQVESLMSTKKPRGQRGE